MSVRSLLISASDPSSTASEFFPSFRLRLLRGTSSEPDIWSMVHERVAKQESLAPLLPPTETDTGVGPTKAFWIGEANELTHGKSIDARSADNIAAVDEAFFPIIMVSILYRMSIG
mmetsp:Transcript_10652/g.15552  ORF Transcript_10652/g.15552 Transcript_10652/m.15552 type:complete len:116 (+) Transcript_10652:708-1055(+)